MKLPLFTFVILTLLLLKPSSVIACSCSLPLTPLEELEKSTAVFSGKVTDIDFPIGIKISSADPVKVTFEVSKTWKGPNSKTLIVATARHGASCGYSFKQGEEYLVYAYNEEDKLSASLCSRTELLSSAETDLQELGLGNTPTNSDSDGSKSDLTIIIIVTSLILIILLIVIFLRKSKNLYK